MGEAVSDAPKATYLEDEYRFLWEELDVEIAVERIREERGSLRADFSANSASGGGFMPMQTIDLRSGESAKRLGNVWGTRLLDGDTWFDLIMKAQRLTRERYQSGEPSVILKDVDWISRPRFLLYPLVEQEVRSILFGDGGVSKSLHLLAAGVSIATGQIIIPGTQVFLTGPVLYLDWEDEPATHAERLQAICEGAGIEVPSNIIYMRRVGSLHESTREIRREIARSGAIFAIVDSVGAACGGDPEKASDVIRCFDSMRALGISVAAIHHVTKDQKDKTKPFGSVYSHNMVRLTWRLDGERNGNELYIRARSFKANNSGDLPALGHRLVFETNDDGRLTSVRFTTASASHLPALAGNTLRNRIAAAMARLGVLLTVDEIAAEIDAPTPSVRTTINRNKDWFTSPHEDGRWGLLAKDTQNTVTEQSDNSVKTLRNNRGLPIRHPVTGVLPEVEEGEQELPW